MNCYLICMGYDMQPYLVEIAQIVFKYVQNATSCSIKYFAQLLCTANHLFPIQAKIYLNE